MGTGAAGSLIDVRTLCNKVGHKILQPRTCVDTSCLRRTDTKSFKVGTCTSRQPRCSGVQSSLSMHFGMQIRGPRADVEADAHASCCHAGDERFS